MLVSRNGNDRRVKLFSLMIYFAAEDTADEEIILQFENADALDNGPPARNLTIRSASTVLICRSLRISGS